MCTQKRTCVHTESQNSVVETGIFRDKEINIMATDAIHGSMCREAISCCDIDNLG